MGIQKVPIELSSKIFQVLEYGHEKFPELEFYSGHYVSDYAIGGHTHFSIEPTPKIIAALDVVLGSLSNCIDDKQQKLKRERSGYGKKGSYRKKSYGFEYRTPGQFFVEPKYCSCPSYSCKLAVHWGSGRQS